MKDSSKRIISNIATIVFLTILEVVFFRNILLTNMLPGDKGDGRLIMHIMEHYYRVFQGKEAFTELMMFYPTKEALGYSDMLLGYGIVHSILRVLGLDIYSAYKYTAVIVHYIGLIGMYTLLRKKLCCSNLWTAFGVSAFAFTPVMATAFCHLQIQVIMLVPFLIIQLIDFCRCFNGRKERNVHAILAITLLALITYTSWYIGFFCGLFAIIFAIVYLICERKHSRELLLKLKEIWRDLIFYFLYCVAIFAPFIYIYLPVLKRTGGFGYTGVYLPDFIDIVSLPKNNPILGKLYYALRLNERGYTSESEMGYSIMLVIAVICMIGIGLSRKKEPDNAICEKHSIVEVSRLRRSMLSAAGFRYCRCALISILICTLLIVRISSNGASLWIAVYYLLPIAKGIRAVGRLLFWLGLMLSIVVTYLLDNALAVNKSCRCIVGIFAIAFVCITDYSDSGIYSYLSSEEEALAVANVAEPPADAECFFIANAREHTANDIYNQVYAFAIATKYNLPTINGYSGNTPANYGAINLIDGPVYLQGIEQWCRDNGLGKVYRYDTTNDIWTRFVNVP